MYLVTNCSASHTNEDLILVSKNEINIFGICVSCTREHYIQDFGTWSTDGGHESVYSSSLKME
ncbi:hypothetical protein Glove_221g54 [Diversispora epigaea]|uniref:Uncharacterized protein n=1 Tax=Diversispora epigaea TaxID=1348612 RepID=A0A397IFA1_9GLOM|nr:hypothetical protein Glove_221g54 [Diversispora epigaea]